MPQITNKDPDMLLERKSRRAEQINAYRRANRAKVREWERRTIENNPAYREKRNARARDWYRKNHQKALEEARVRNRSNYQKNKDVVKQHIKAWRAAHPEYDRAKFRNYYAHKRSILGTHSQKDIEALYNSQKGKCPDCGCRLAKSGKGKFWVDHVEPISGPRATNDPSNLRLTCMKCNIAKSNKDPYEYAQSVGKLFV